MYTRDHLGENILFACAQTGNKELLDIFAEYEEFHKAKSARNYKGQTVEHIICMHKHLEFTTAIMPSANNPDYYGNHPLFYSVMQNDVDLIKKCFKRGRDYLTLRNYKYRTLLHIAARYNSIDAVK